MTFVRPATLDAGVVQLQLALSQTKPKTGKTMEMHPRVALWNACDVLINDREFVEAGLRVLYENNQIVSFLFNTIVPHIEERLRTDTLREELTTQKEDSVTQNKTRYDAIIAALNDAIGLSEARDVSERFANMRNAMKPLAQNATVKSGLLTLYVSSKTARKALDMILERLLHTFEHDRDIQKTTDIPFDAMMLG